MIRLTRKEKTVAIFVTAAFLIAPLIATGCTAAPPSGGEFQKETTPSAKKTTETKQTAKTVPGKVEGYEIYENKDPFQPLVGAGAQTQTQTVTTTTTTPDGGVTSTSAQVKLITIPLGDSAAIEVNGTLYEGLKVGDTFANNFKLMSIGTGSVIIQYGDNQYTLYLGETLNVK